jgi:hypothetical protein
MRIRVRYRAYRVAYSLTWAFGVATAWLAAGYREGNAFERAMIVPIWAPCRLASNVCFVLTAQLAGEAGRRVRPRE